MKEETESNAQEEFILHSKPCPIRSKSMHISSFNVFNAVPTIHPKNSPWLISPMKLAKAPMTEIKEDAFLESNEEGEDYCQVDNQFDYQKKKVASGKAVSNKNMDSYIMTRIDSSEKKTPNSFELSPINHVLSPTKRRSSILLSLEKKRKNTMG